MLIMSKQSQEIFYIHLYCKFDTLPESKMYYIFLYRYKLRMLFAYYVILYIVLYITPKT